MKIEAQNLESMILDYIDQIKVLISPEIWESVLLDCSKNELLILFLLYRTSDVNMSQIAEYINAPLNTTTGIVARMEKKEMVTRERSTEDKRVVTIVLAPMGKEQIGTILKQFLQYGQLILGALTPQELELTGNILDKVIQILRTDAQTKEPVSKSKIKRIPIL